MLGLFVWAGRYFCSFLLAVFCFHPVLSCILPVYFLEPRGSFLINILLFTNHKKKF